MIPLFSTEQIREVDAFAINKMGMPGIILMENASLSIFHILADHFSETALPEEIGLICGKGNNGGDGFAVARHLANFGFKVSVIYLGDEDDLSPDCRTNFRIFKNLSENNKNITLRHFASIKDVKVLEHCDVIIDALLGSGIKGSLKEPYGTIVNKLNSMTGLKVAIDIPTGFDADTGYSENSFIADLTITLGELKKGLFFGTGPVSAGVIKKGDIGINASFFDRFDVSEYLLEPEDAHLSLPEKKKDAHKYSAGKVLTIAGSGDFPGAAVLTSTAALRIGAGASILCYPKSTVELVHKNISEVVVHTYDDNGNEYLKASNISELNERLEWADVLAMGPGLNRAEETQTAVRHIIKDRKCRRMVIDADALFAIGGGRYKDFNLRNLVLTPHHGEFANLLGIELSEIKKNLLAYGKNFVKETGAYLVLKGAPTIIFTPYGDALINTTGNSGMAKFGTGDVLTGVIAGLMSQQGDIENSIIAAVYLHSLTGDLLLNKFTEYSFTAMDIINNLGEGIKFLRKSIA